MVKEWSNQGLKIGIIAVDPSSPFSGGAFLGDRIRMRNLSGKENIYIRSVASRGSVGGLCDSIYDIVDVMKSFGFDKIIIETVGAGQSEIEVIFVADTILLVLSPNTGDEIQMFKAGIMEIADAYVVNKMDLPEADKFVLQLKNTLSLESETKSKIILPISAIRNENIKNIVNWIDNHFEEIKKTGEYEFRKKRRMKRRVRSSIIRNIDGIIESSNFDFENMIDLKEKIIKYICEVDKNEKIDHIGIAVKSIEDALKLYNDLLGLEITGEEVLEDRGLKVAFIKAGDTRIELLEPLHENSEISGFLAKKGEGIHHIAYEVANVKDIISKSKELGLKPLSDEPKPGAHNTKVVFLHPKTTNGVLVELVEHNNK
ncbi:methylmalonyl-CoA epimerase [Marinitoga lauensis]|uniref:methylmalonyl-CoA epimerase n=1 Tax=Marinitoga lauensis TaxID=2201189 RepID=UPI001404423D|nr:methylmalonyl-CoA epimerase [Marinitoga lauensis]